MPEIMIIENIRSRGGSEAAERVDVDSDAELLRRFDLEPEELRDGSEGQSLVATWVVVERTSKRKAIVWAARSTVGQPALQVVLAERRWGTPNLQSLPVYQDR